MFIRLTIELVSYIYRNKNMAYKNGFTLIELIVTLVLVGIMGAGITFFLVPGIKGYILMQENADLTQKAQFAITRLAQEFRNCYDCNGTGEIPRETLIHEPGDEYEYENSLEDRKLAWVGDKLQINGNTLVDQVQSFEVTREQEGEDNSPVFMEIELVLALEQNQGTKTYKSTIYCRNTYR